MRRTVRGPFAAILNPAAPRQPLHFPHPFDEIGFQLLEFRDLLLHPTEIPFSFSSGGIQRFRFCPEFVLERFGRSSEETLRHFSRCLSGVNRQHANSLVSE